MNILISYDVNTTEPEGQRRLRHVVKFVRTTDKEFRHRYLNVH